MPYLVKQDQRCLAALALSIRVAIKSDINGFSFHSLKYEDVHIREEPESVITESRAYFFNRGWTARRVRCLSREERIKIYSTPSTDSVHGISASRSISGGSICRTPPIVLGIYSLGAAIESAHRVVGNVVLIERIGRNRSCKLCGAEENGSTVNINETIT